MALSNMGREPRREITESLVGLVVFAVFMYCDYHFALWFHKSTESVGACPIPVGLIIGVFIAILVLGLLAFTHWIGDEFCNFLDNRGIHLRPKRRY